MFGVRRVNALFDPAAKGTLTQTIDGIVYRAQWFVDNHAVVLHVESPEPSSSSLFGLLIGDTPESVAIRLFRDYLARSKGIQADSGSLELKPSSG